MQHTISIPTLFYSANCRLLAILLHFRSESGNFFLMFRFHFAEISLEFGLSLLFFLISPMSNLLPVYRITSNWYWVWSHPLYFESCLKYNKQKIWRILQQLQNKETQTNNKQRKITIHGRCKHYISQAL